MPFYNAELTLNRAIQSIINQTLKDFELILIDNNSTDDSKNIAIAWKKKDMRIKVILEQHQGVVFASNTGWKVSKGKYIARMDSDDESLPDRLSLQAKFLDENPKYGAITGLAKHISHSKNTEGFSRFVKWSNSIKSFEEIKNNRFIEMPIINPTAMWRRETAEKYEMYKDGDFPEDYEMWLRWLNNGVKIGKLPCTVLNWHDYDTRLTRTNAMYSDNAFYKIKTKYLAKWLSENNPFFPNVVIWGASRISRRRAKLLEQYGIEITAYIDIKKSRQIDKKIIYYKDIPNTQNLFILTYIKQMNARKKIHEFLDDKGYVEGKNYLHIS